MLAHDRSPAIDEYIATSTRVLRYLAPFVTATLREAGVRVCDAEVRARPAHLLAAPCRVAHVMDACALAAVCAAAVMTLQPLAGLLGCATDLGISRRADGRAHAPLQGGFYIMPDFEHCPRAQRYREGGATTAPAAALVLDALTNAHVAMLPGHNFGLSPDALVSRMAFVDFDGGAAMEVRREHRCLVHVHAIERKRLSASNALATG